MEYDVIIVGGGTAGCVLAARLTEDPDRSVLLLEAGPDFARTEEIPADILSAKYPPMSHDWGYRARSTDESEPISLPRGKIIGGSSSTNYCFAARTRPADHDAWEARGLDGWGWADVLPIYRAMESDAYGDEQWHGREGLFHVSRPTWDEIAPTAQAFGEVAAKLGMPVLDDVNAPGEPGFGIVPRNVGEGELRQSLAITYVNPVRDRPNLRVRGKTLVDRILFDDARAVGVLLADGTQIAAGEVVVSAGAINSPAILLRSGVGPLDELERHGIPVVRELPGVGRNLVDHPVYWNIYSAKPTDAEVATVFQSALSVRISDDEPDYDLHLLPSSVMPSSDVPAQYVAPTDDHPTGFDFVVFVSNVQPRSRGTVTLASRDPAAAPRIDLNFYSADGDVEIMAEGIKLARRLVQESPLADLIVAERAPGADVSDDELVAAVRKGSTHYNHVSGTCRMGVVEDPAAVVDGQARVLGIQGLRVIDASIMPTIPRVAINPTTVMIAEKLATTF